MVMPKLPASERRSEPVYVLLRPREMKVLQTVAKKRGWSYGAVLRDLFLRKHVKPAKTD